MRNRAATFALLVLAASCTDVTTQSDSYDSTPIQISPANPPPPVIGDPADPPACFPGLPGCAPVPVQVSVGARFFRNPGGSVAWVTFFSTIATTVVSSDAMVRDGGNGLIGRGTITADISTGRIVIDLSTAQGSLLQSPRPGGREFLFTSQARYLASDLPMSGGVLFWYAY